MPDDVVVNWPFLIANWKRVTAAILAGLAIAAIAYVSVTPLWESTALLQSGQITTLSYREMTTDIESADAIVAKVMRPAFIKAAMQKAALPEQAQALLPRQYGGKGRLKVRVMNSGLIVISLRAATPELATRMMKGVVAQIVDEQRQLAATELQSNQEMLVLVQKIPRPDKSPHDDMDMLTIHLAQAVGDVEVLSQPAFPDPFYFAGCGIGLGILFAAGLLCLAKRTDNALFK